MKCGATALVPYYRPGDPAVADAIKGLAGKYSSVLLANHGPVVSGDTLEAAVFAIEELEETAKLYLLLRGLNPRYLTPAQVADLTKVFGLALPEQGTEAIVPRMLRNMPRAAWCAANPGSIRHGSRLCVAALHAATTSVEHADHNPRYALRTSGLPLISAAVPCISTRPVCRM